MPHSDAPLPASIALVDDDVEYTEFLAQHLRELGVQVHRFADSDELLADRTGGVRRPAQPRPDCRATRTWPRTRSPSPVWWSGPSR